MQSFMSILRKKVCLLFLVALALSAFAQEGFSMNTDQSGKQVVERAKKKKKAAQEDGDDDEYVEKTSKKKKKVAQKGKAKSTKGKKRGKASSDSDPFVVPPPPAKKSRTTRNSNKTANPIPPSPALNTEQHYTLVPATPFAVDTLDAEFAGVVMDAIMVPPTPMPPPPTPLPTPQGGEDPADDELMAPTSQTTLTTTTTMTNQVPLPSSQTTVGTQNPTVPLASTSGNTQAPPRLNNGVTQAQAFPILAAPTLPVTKAPPAQRQHPSFLLKPTFPKPVPFFTVLPKVTQAPPPTLVPPQTTFPKIPVRLIPEPPKTMQLPAPTLASLQTTFPKIPVRLIPVPAQTTPVPSPILVPPQTIEAKRTPPQQLPENPEQVIQVPLGITAAQLLAPSYSASPAQPSVTQNTDLPSEECLTPEIIHNLGKSSRKGDSLATFARSNLNTFHEKLLDRCRFFPKGTPTGDKVHELRSLVEGALGFFAVPPVEPCPPASTINFLSMYAKEGDSQARTDLIEADRKITVRWAAMCGTPEWHSLNKLKKKSRDALASLPAPSVIAPVPFINPVATTNTTMTPILELPPEQQAPTEDFLTPDDIAMLNTQVYPDTPPVTTTTTTAVTTTTTTTTVTPVQAPTTQVVVTPSFDEVKRLASLARRGDLAARTQVLELVKNAQYHDYLRPQRIGFWNWKNVQTLVSTEPLYCSYASCYTESCSKAPNLFEELKAKATPDNLWAVLGLVRVYHGKGQKNEIFSLLKSVEGKGNTEIETVLGQLYVRNLQGNMSKTEQFQKGIALLTSTANKGNLLALRTLGLLYETPKDLNLQKDINLALSLLTKAAQQGNAPAQWNLACLYRGGMNNQPLFLEWCKQAAYQGYRAANTALGRTYKDGTIPPKNDALGFYHCLVGQDVKDKDYVHSLLVNHTPQYDSPQVTFEEHLTKIKTGKKLGAGELPLAGLEFILKWNQDKIQEEEKAEQPSDRIKAIHKNVEAFAKDSSDLVADLEAINPAFFEISGRRFSQKVFADTLSQPDRPQIRITAARNVNLGEHASDASSLLHTFLGKLDDRQNTVCQGLRTLWAEAQKNQQEDDRDLYRLRGRTGKDKEREELRAAIEKWGKRSTEIGEQITAIETVGTLWKTLRGSTAKNRRDLFDEECSFKPKAQ